jgi:hypothetical protein
MERWKQYGGLTGLLAVFLAAGLWGFTATGGALPWAKRSARALQEGAQAGRGALVDVGRGVVVAGPIRQGGLLVEYLALVLVLAGIGIGVYVYVDRYGGLDDEKGRYP